jgi:uncharacterized membrane protein YesL
MRDALRTFGEALRDIYGEIVLLVQMNIVTVLLLLPVVTGPPAMAGLWAVGNRVAHGEQIGWQDYWAAFRTHFGRAWGLAGLNLAALVVVGANLWFYTPSNTPLKISDELAAGIRGVWLAMGLLWLLLSQYLLPVLMEQEDLRLRTTLRNATALMIRSPGYSFVLLLLIFLIGILSALLVAPWLVITPAFLAVLTNNAVLYLLKADRE